MEQTGAPGGGSVVIIGKEVVLDDVVIGSLATVDTRFEHRHFFFNNS